MTENASILKTESNTFLMPKAEPLTFSKLAKRETQKVETVNAFKKMGLAASRAAKHGKQGNTGSGKAPTSGSSVINTASQARALRMAAAPSLSTNANTKANKGADAGRLPLRVGAKRLTSASTDASSSNTAQAQSQAHVRVLGLGKRKLAGACNEGFPRKKARGGTVAGTSDGVGLKENVDAGSL